MSSGGNDAAGPFATCCYRYTLTGTDNVGNVATLTTTVKVDRAAPSSTSATWPIVTGAPSWYAMSVERTSSTFRTRAACRIGSSRSSTRGMKTASNSRPFAPWSVRR